MGRRLARRLPRSGGTRQVRRHAGVCLVRLVCPVPWEAAASPGGGAHGMFAVVICTGVYRNVTAAIPPCYT